MSKLIKVFFLIGVMMTIVGSFLPWWTRHTFVWGRYCGIQPPLCLTPYQGGAVVIGGYGGYIVIVLSIFLFLIQYRPVKVLFELKTWNIIIPGIIFSIAVCFLGEFLTLYLHVLEKPDLNAGLVMIFLGASLLLLTALVERRMNM